MQISPINNDTIILEQLDKLLKSSCFSNSQILKRFLTLVVTKTVRGEGEQLKEYVIGVEALGKPIDFDPQTDASVRIHATRLRKMLVEYYSSQGKSDPISITIPKGRYTPVFRKNHTPFLDAMADINGSKRQFVKKPIVVVLPIEPIGEHAQLGQFCHLLLHQLTVELAKFQELSVVSCQEYLAKDNNRESTTLNYIVSGFYACVDNQWQVTIELNDVITRQVVWNESFVVGQLHDDHSVDFKGIIRKVIGTICGYMGIIFQNAIKTYLPGESELLYGIYWYNHYHQHYSAESQTAALNAIEKGLEKYPQNAFLTSFKAQILIDLKANDFQGDGNYLAIGTKLAYEAVGYDMASQHAWMIVGWANLLNRNMNGFQLAIDKMLELNPYNHMYYSQYGFAAVCAGQYQKGYDIMTEAVRLNPYYVWNLNLSFCFYHIHNGEYEKALFYANLINRKLLVWDPLLRLAIHGLMESTLPMDETIDEIYRLSPQFNERAPYILDSIIWDKDLQLTILRGLKNAGIPVV